MNLLRLLPGLLVLVLACASPLVRAQAADADEEEYFVTGVEIRRTDGRYLGLAVEGNAFVLRFYDEEKKPESADAIRAMARWNSPVKAGQQRTVLASAGDALRSPPVVRPPLAFVAFLTMIAPDGEVLESHAFNMRTVE